MAEKLVVVEDQLPSFIRRQSQSELNRVHKKLDKITEESIDTMLMIMRDAKADPKLRQKCASDLLHYKVVVAKEINDDNLKRQIAQIKLGDKTKKNLGVDTDPEGDDTPPKASINFGQIQQVNDD